MILGIDIPFGAKVEMEGNRILVSFDESASMDLWKAKFYMWLTEGFTPEDFLNNRTLSEKSIEISHSDKIKVG